MFFALALGATAVCVGPWRRRNTGATRQLLELAAARAITVAWSMPRRMRRSQGIGAGTSAASPGSIDADLRFRAMRSPSSLPSSVPCLRQALYLVSTIA